MSRTSVISEERKHFFFEKKKQKTFTHYTDRQMIRVTASAMSKGFLLPSCKKEVLPFLRSHPNHQSSSVTDITERVGGTGIA
jgi:hypothetical protein